MIQNNTPPKDHGPEPFLVNIDRAASQNCCYRSTLWTGDDLQVTLMSIPAGGEVGLEMHPDFDQFIRIEAGCALILMGTHGRQLNIRQRVTHCDAMMIPAGTWHNLVNTGNTPLKLYSVYGPPHHPRGTVHKTKKDADQEHNGY